MKIKHICYAALCSATLMASGCSYLNVDPELGLEDSEVFGTYSNFRSYFDWLYASGNGTNKENILYAFPMYSDFLQKYSFSWYNTTDMSDAGRMGVTQQYFKQGTLTQDFLKAVTFDSGSADKPLAKAMFSVIRRCNTTIARIDECADATEKQRGDLLGQAYAIRGFCYFSLCRFFGGMPYMTHALQAEESWDLPRLSSHDTYVLAAEDLRKGYELLKEAGYMRRNSPSDLASATLDQINGTAAVGLYARALLYAASEENNENGAEDWKDAAEAAALALQEALDAEFTLTPAASYTTNFLSQRTTNENIWVYALQTKDNHANLSSIMAYPQSAATTGSSGVCPTQNFVDRYETVYGEPLLTEADRAAAAAAGHYSEQAPYRGRDPRLDLTIVRDGQPNSNSADGKINIYYDPALKAWPTTRLSGVNVSFGIDWGTRDNDTYAYSNTGYYCRKYWNGVLGLKQQSNHYHEDPVIRLAELYLNYAEAVNEAYGPSGRAGKMSLTAVQALNAVRSRIGMPDVLTKYTSDKESLRERIRNERCVELAFEGHHYYHDTRRWKIAPRTMGTTLYGMYVEKTDVSAEHPEGKIYTRKALPNNRQCVWKDYMYYIPFPDSEAFKMQNFVNWSWK